MQLFLQFGHGMIDHTKTLLRAWGDGGVILSPRDLKPEQIVRVGREVTELGREVLVDPQCFAHDSDHPRLLSHDHFRSFSGCATSQLFSRQGACEIIQPLVSYARDIGAARLLIPGLLARPVSKEWLRLQTHLVEVAGAEGDGLQLVATVALDSDSVRNEEAIEAVVDAATDWRVPAVYVVAEAPSQYLVDDPTWLANVLLLVSGLKLQQKEVILGYANHQMLCAAAANVDCIASGTWLNVRAFPIDKFYQPAEDEESRRTTWFYCPQSLSEYKLPFLDIAKRVGVLGRMQPPATLGSTHADPLFGAAEPGTVNWREPDAFRHYLTCLRGQCSQVTAGSFDQALAKQKALLDDAAVMARGLAGKGIRGDYRDFAGYFDVNHAALAVLEHARGARLKREW